MSSQPDCCTFFMQLNSSCVCIRANALLNLQLCYFMGLCYSAVFPTKSLVKEVPIFSHLRTVPTIVIAHTFCASPDTRISYRQYLLIQGYFCAV